MITSTLAARQVLFGRTTAMFHQRTPFVVCAAGMATLRETQMRLKSIKNIGKITKSMKMIASTKLNRAQRGMEAARRYGNTAEEFFKQAETTSVEGKNPCIVVMTSDKGLCGAIHSSVTKAAKKYAKTFAQPPAMVVVGDRSRAQVAREYRNQIFLSFSVVGKDVPTFAEAASIAEMIQASDQKFDQITVVHNKFVSAIAYEPKFLKVFDVAAIAASPKIYGYEIDDDDCFEWLQEFAFANQVFWGLLEGHAAEFAARRTAMENATKNADEMVQKLTLLYNRTRQAVVTNELVEIITGASAL